MKTLKLKAKVLRRKTILLVVSGSIAAYKAVDLINRLREEGSKVICVMTESAKQFITPLTLRATSGNPVYHDFFSPDMPYDVIHTSLAEEADLILVAPASANFIARLAAGFADDLASCVILAAKCPIVIAPTMNDHMYRHPLTQQNIEKLTRAGYRIIEPEVGHLICGKHAVGHIPDPKVVIEHLGKIL